MAYTYVILYTYVIFKYSFWNYVSPTQQNSFNKTTPTCFPYFIKGEVEGVRLERAEFPLKGGF